MFEGWIQIRRLVNVFAKILYVLYVLYVHVQYIHWICRSIRRVYLVLYSTCTCIALPKIAYDARSHCFGGSDTGTAVPYRMYHTIQYSTVQYKYIYITQFRTCTVPYIHPTSSNTWFVHAAPWLRLHDVDVGRKSFIRHPRRWDGGGLIRVIRVIRGNTGNTVRGCASSANPPPGK